MTASTAAPPDRRDLTANQRARAASELANLAKGQRVGQAEVLNNTSGPPVQAPVLNRTGGQVRPVTREEAARTLGTSRIQNRLLRGRTGRGHLAYLGKVLVRHLC